MRAWRGESTEGHVPGNWNLTMKPLSQKVPHHMLLKNFLSPIRSWSATGTTERSSHMVFLRRDKSHDTRGSGRASSTNETHRETTYYGQATRDSPSYNNSTWYGTSIRYGKSFQYPYCETRDHVCVAIWCVANTRSILKNQYGEKRRSFSISTRPY